MILMMKVLSLSLIVSLCFSCSLMKISLNSTSAPPGEQRDREEKEVEEGKKATFERVSKKLHKLIEEAKKSGKSAVDYLASDLYLKASDASLRGDSRTACFLYKHTLKLNPNDGFLKKKYAIELIRTGDLIKAEKILYQLFEKDRDKDAMSGLILGGVYSVLNRRADARKIYLEVLKYHKGNEEACIFLSKSYALEKEFKKANKVLDDCSRHHKSKAIFTYYKGRFAFDQNKKMLAVRYFQEALRKGPTFYQAVVALGVIYEEKEKYRKAVDTYERFLKVSHSNYIILSRLVQLLLSLSEFKKVVPYLEELVRIDDSDLNSKLKLGILYVEGERYDDAKKLFKDILHVHPDSDKVLHYLGAISLKTNDKEAAISYFSKVSPSDPLFNDSNLKIAIILRSLAKNNEQIKRFIEFVQEKSKQKEGLKIELLILLAEFYEGNNDYVKAISLLRPLNENKHFKEEYKYYLASLYEKDKKYEKARKIIEIILEDNPNNPHALNFLGYSLLELEGDLDKAYEYISRAIKLRPNDGFIRDSLGWYYYKKRDLKKALQQIKIAWEQTKNDMVIAKHLAIIYQELKDYEMAKKYYKEALKYCRFESERKKLFGAISHIEVLRTGGGNLRKPATGK